MRQYSYSEFFEDVTTIARNVRANFEPDTIVAIARGGLSFGHFLAHALNVRRLYALNSIHYEEQKKLDTVQLYNIPDLGNSHKVLIVDDIIDTGESMVVIKEHLEHLYPDIQFRIATLFYKPRALLRPDFFARETDEWVRFLWDYSLDGITQFYFPLTLTHRDYRNAGILESRAVGDQLIAQIVVTVFAAVLVLGSAVRLLLQGAFVWELLALTLGLTLLYFFCIKPLADWRHNRKRKSVDLSMAFGDEAIVINMPGTGVFTRQWQEVVQYVENLRGILFCYEDGTTNWLPERVFVNESERQAFRAFLQMKVKMPEESDDR